MADYRIAPADRNGLGLALDWAAAEGWNPGPGDLDSFFAADPSGFLLGWQGDAPIASISAVKYGNDFGFIGLYIVAPAQRGRGFGLRLWEAAMDSLQGRVIGLDGVVAQQDNYRRSGFVLAHRNVRHAGPTRGASPVVRTIVELSGLPFEDVLAFDTLHFPTARPGFLAAWLRQPGMQSLGWVEGGRLRGMGCVRPCREGYKIGPLHADSADIAAALFDALSARLPAGSTINLDLPEPNLAARALAESRGLRPAFETARMYRGPAPALPLGHIFGITSFELG